MEEKIEDTKAVIGSRNSEKDRQYNGKMKKTKGQIMINKTLYRKLKIEQHDISI